MALFSKNFIWPSESVVFEALSDGVQDCVAEVVERDGRLALKSPGKFSGTTGQSNERTLTTELDGKSALIRGSLAFDGDFGLLVDEVRVGSLEPNAQYVRVTATFENLASPCSYRPEDGAARNFQIPRVFPKTNGAPKMEALLPSGTDSIILNSQRPLPLENFESQLAVFQSMLTFAADILCGRLSLVATDQSGHDVLIYGRDKYAPIRYPPQNPSEYASRLSASWSQHAINQWWSIYSGWKPVAQIISGLRYQSGENAELRRANEILETTSASARHSSFTLNLNEMHSLVVKVVVCNNYGGVAEAKLWSWCWNRWNRWNPSREVTLIEGGRDD